MGLRNLVRALGMHRWMIALITLLAIGLSLAWTLRQTPTYTSTTQLFVSAPDNAPKAGKASDLITQRVQSYAALLDGDQIAQRVVKQLNLSETAGQLSQKIDASASGDTVLLTIWVGDPSPDRAQLLANAVAKEFIVFVKELETPGVGADVPVKVTTVDAASKPTKPSSPQPALNLGIGLLAGLLLGGLFAVLRERLDSTVRSAEVLEETTAAPLLGAILFDDDAYDEPTIRELDSYDPRAEAFRVVRTSLQFIHPDEASKVFVVTSAVPGEGKTTTAINLALILAEGGEHVALVEADLRRPTISEYLGLVDAVGLTTVLVGRTTLDDALQEVGALDVLTSGRRPPNPAELVKSEAMHALIERLREKYAYVLIDAPPLLPVTDASLLAAASDGVILVTRYGDTKQTELQTAVRRLDSVDGEIVGTVLNMAPASDVDGYGYGYGYAPDSYDPEASRREKQKKVAAEKPAKAERPPRVEKAPKPPKAEKPAKPVREPKPPKPTRDERKAAKAAAAGAGTGSVAATDTVTDEVRAFYEQHPVLAKPVVDDEEFVDEVELVDDANLVDEVPAADEPDLSHELEPEIEPALADLAAEIDAAINAAKNRAQPKDD